MLLEVTEVVLTMIQGALVFGSVLLIATLMRHMLR